MAIKPPPISDVFRSLNEVFGDSGLKGEVDRSMKSLLQSALSRLDMVSREEFDSQTEILARTRARVEELEQLVSELEKERN